jgi:hypothetical protein
VRYPPLVAASLLACLPATAAAAPPIVFDCPRVIDIAQTTLTSDPAWELVADTELPPATLSTVAVYTQHPSDGGNLVADQTERTEQTEVTWWRLPPDSAPYWMACVYHHSRILLAKPVPLEARQCRLTSALRGQQPAEVLSFVCE